MPKPVEAELAPQDGLLPRIRRRSCCSAPTATAPRAARAPPLRLDHADAHRPDRHRIAYLSIPRDLRVEIPGYGTRKINAALQLGGAALALKTVESLTGLEVNHVAIVDFDDFASVIDALGGVDVDVPKPILSNNFDCPYATRRAARAGRAGASRRGRSTWTGGAR